MNLLLRTIAFVSFVAAPVYYLGVATTPSGQNVLGLGLCWALLWWLVWHSYRKQLGGRDEYTGSGGPTHPLAAIVQSAGSSLLVLGGLAMVFFLAWMIGYWTPPNKGLALKNGKMVSTDVAAGQAPSEPAPEVLVPQDRVDIAIVDTHFDNAIQFVTVVVTNPADGQALGDILLDDFVVAAAGKRQTILTAAQTSYERPVAVGIIRDVSGSVLASPPFGEITLDSTTAIIQSAREELRAPVVGIVDFAGESVVTLSWTTELAKLGTIPLGKPNGQDATAMGNMIVHSCKSLARRWERRRLCLISDGGNTVKSSFDLSGIVAEANRCDVAIDIVGLPTRALTAERVELLKFLAEKTGGTYLDGATPSLKASIARVVDGWRMPLPAYRFSFQSPQQVIEGSLQVSLLDRSRSPVGKPVLVPARVAERNTWDRLPE